MKVSARLLVLFLSSTALAVASPHAALADEPTQSTGTLVELLSNIPVLPPMEVAYNTKYFPGLTPFTASEDNASANFGTSPARPYDIVVPVISPAAVWASGAYGWSPQLRAAAGERSDDAAVSLTGESPEFSLNDAPWGGLMTQVSAPIGRTVWKKCRSSFSLTCVVDALPVRLRSLASTSVVLMSVRYRLAMTAEEKEVLRRWITPVWSSNPELTFAVTTTEAPTLPTTYDSDASGRVVDATLFGVLAPPATGSFPTVPYSGLRLWDSGVSWKDIEPSPGRYRWAVLDSAMTFARTHDKRVLLVLGPVPQWASAEPERPDESWGKGAGGPLTSVGKAAFARYVSAILDRYGDSIYALEVWNEANLPTFWRGTPAEMAEMTDVVFQAVADRGLATRVYSASATTRVAGSIYRFFPAYLRELELRGWPVDGFAVHAYPDADGTASDMAGLVAQFKAYLAIAGAPDLPIANTELNYGLAGPGDKPHRDIPKVESQGWLARTFLDSVRLGLEDTYWFAWTPKYYEQLGIQLNPSTRATITAWTSIYTWMVGATFQGCTEPLGAVLCEFTRDDTPFWITYADRPTVVAAPAGVTRSCDLQGQCQPPLGSKVVADVRPVLLTTS